MKQKRILFDLTKTQPINGVAFHGGGKYGKAVFRKLAEVAPEKIAAYYDDKKQLDGAILGLCDEKKIPLVTKSECSVSDAARRFGNLIYSPLIDSAYWEDDAVRTIVTIHGLRALEMPGDEYEDFYKRKSFLRSFFFRTIAHKIYVQWRKKKIFERELKKNRALLNREGMCFVTVSNHSKYSLLSFFPVLRSQEIKVFYSPSVVDEKLSIDGYCNPYGKYFMIVSGDRWLKNGIRAVLALDELFTERPEMEGKVVITGLKSISDISIDVRNAERFVCLGYVDELKLKALYHYAHLLLYPSLNEGFGYPPLEAMYEGCPVVASAISSIQEICDNAVLYVNPYSIPEIKMRILQMEDESMRQELIKKGFERQRYIQQKQNEDLLKLSDFIVSFVK